MTQASSSFDAAQLEAAVRHLQALIRIDTTNPPGNERAAAEYLAELLRADGIEPELLEPEPLRTSLVARLQGDGSRPPLLLHAHLDVVEAEPGRWRRPPFSGDLAEGYLWGRGAIDMKHMAVMCTMVLGRLAREGVRLRRDVIFAAVADEEAGCEKGSRFLCDRHPEKVRAEYALGEVGGFSVHLAGTTLYPVMVAEKGLCWLRATARGTPGHGSMPREDNAVVRLAEAVARLGRRRLPQHETVAARRYVEALAAALPPPVRWIVPRLLDPRLSTPILRLLPDRAVARAMAAVLSNTVSPTVLRAGAKTNVIPGEASCELDGRTLPGQQAADLVREIRAVVGDDVELEVLRSHDGVETQPESPLFDAIARAVERHHPGARAVPYLCPGFTDASSWSRLGMRCYGFVPVRFDPKGDARFPELYHGNDERIPVEGFKWGLGVLYDLVRDFCG